MQTENPFVTLGLSESLSETLSKLGYEEPTPIQTKAIPALLEGRDVLGQAATGTGKTAAFSLPLIQKYCLDDRKIGAPRILILTPTRELCIQVSESINSYGHSSGVIVLPIYGGQDYSRQIKALNRGVHIVVATPGRTLDHIKRGTLDLSKVEATVLDEADEMLDMGFADELDAIFEALPEERQSALFSATMPERIEKLALRQLADPVRIEIPREKLAEGEQPRVKQSAYVVGKNYRAAALGRILDMESPTLAIVFARTRTEVDELSETLRSRGYSVEALHGGLDQQQRDRVMKRARSGAVDVIVATDVAARGIDIDHLTHVINFGIPYSAETYVHRIGRTGRAGREGSAITILEPRETRLLRNIERETKQKISILSVPTVTDVHAKRLDLTKASIHEILAADEGLDRYYPVIESLADEFDLLKVAAAAVKLANEENMTDSDEIVIPNALANPDKKRRDRERTPVKKPKFASEGMVRLFFSAGRDIGVRPQDIVGAIANEAGVSSKKIGAIDISDKFSLVEVDDDIAQSVIKALRDVYIKGRQVIVRHDRPKSERDSYSPKKFSDKPKNFRKGRK
jgi:ATP-dependent RNA helicase DeaD